MTRCLRSIAGTGISIFRLAAIDFMARSECEDPGMVLRVAGPANKVIQGDWEQKNEGPLTDEVGGLVLERRDHRETASR